MSLVVNLIVLTIVWFGFMGAIIFAAAGTLNYTGGWLYLGVMVASSIIFALNIARVDPGLLQRHRGYRPGDAATDHKSCADHFCHLSLATL